MSVLSQINRVYVGEPKRAMASDLVSTGSAPPPAWTPASLPDLGLWLRGDSFTFDTTATWADLSGNGRHYTQTGTNRPTVDGTGLNGQQTVAFDRAASQYLTGNSDTILSSAVAHTVIIVMKQPVFPGPNTYRTIMSVKSASTMWVTWLTNDVFYGDCAFGFANSKIMGSTAGWGSSAYNLFVSTYNGSGDSTSTNFSLEKNGAAQVVAGPKASSAGNNLNVVGRYGSTGGSDYFDGQIAEIIVMTSSISAPDRASLETYINTRYAIVIS